MLQKVKNDNSENQNNHGEFRREVFQISREFDFFSERELVSQTGHSRKEWPLVILKELIDNSLDACEEVGTTPTIRVTADSCGITVSDNGPGIPESTILGVLDFTTRTSSRAAYVAPDRGSQGNALKTLLAMPFVVDPAGGALIVTARGKRQTLRCIVDPITEQVSVQREPEDWESNGTTIRLEWSVQDDSDKWPFDPESSMTPEDSWTSLVANRARALLDSYGLSNPHLTLVVDWFGDCWTMEPTDVDWVKWMPGQAPSAHWYTFETLGRLVAACVTADSRQNTSRTVARFLENFDGLSGSAKRKRVLEAVGLSREPLTGTYQRWRIE